MKTELKNPIQLVTWRDIKDKELNDEVHESYLDNIRSSDTYVRYYPNSDDFYFKDGFHDRMNKWLIDNGYKINKDRYFHLLIRIDW